MPEKTFNLRRLARDHLSTSSHANKQVTQLYKTRAFIYTVLQNIENARAGRKIIKIIFNLISIN